MSQVSVSSIYTLCIFTTGRMIRMLVSSEENVGAIFFGYSKETRSISGVSYLSDVIACFQRTCQSCFPELFHILQLILQKNIQLFNLSEIEISIAREASKRKHTERRSSSTSIANISTYLLCISLYLAK